MKKKKIHNTEKKKRETQRINFGSSSNPLTQFPFRTLFPSLCCFFIPNWLPILACSITISQMAASSTHKNRYTATTLLFLFLFLLCMFIFSRRTLEPALSLYRDDLLVQASPISSSPLPSSNNYHIAFPEHVSVQNSTADSEPEPEPEAESVDLSTSQSLSSLPQTKPIEPESSTVSRTGNEISVNDENNPISKNEITSTVDDDNRNQEPEPVELSTNQSLSSLPQTKQKEPESSTVSRTDNEISVNDQNNLISKNEITATVDDDDSNLELDKQLECDLYMGTWVKDDKNYPIYKPGSCPYVDEAYDCQSNGRVDSEYTKWRWKPDGCDLPRFNATDFLVRLRGRRLMMVGDSMNRNQFESILCMLREGLHNKSKMYEIHGHKITKGRGYFVFKFEDYDCTVEFVRSHFLVKEGTRINPQGSSNPILSIDRIDKTSGRWKRADILVFNTGHWWTHGKTARGINYYKEGDFLYPKFDAVEAYRRALKTWAKWIDNNINPRKQTVYYRGYSSAHFRGGDWDSGGSCNGESEPVSSGAILDNYPLKMKIVEEVIKEMRVPVKLLNVTKLTNFRKDGHPSVYGKNTMAGKKVSLRRQDCSHWCLPGVPDMWNELIYATLLFQQTNSRT